MHPPTAAIPLLSPTERRLYGRLVRAFPGHIVFAQVVLSRFLAARPIPQISAAKPGVLRHRTWVADFVVCLPDFRAVAVIELDCPAGARRDRHRRRDQLLRAAGIKVVRVLAADLPNELALKSLVAALPLHSSTEQLLRRAS